MRPAGPLRCQPQRNQPPPCPRSGVKARRSTDPTTSEENDGTHDASPAQRLRRHPRPAGRLDPDHGRLSEHLHHRRDGARRVGASPRRCRRPARQGAGGGGDGDPHRQRRWRWHPVRHLRRDRADPPEGRPRRGRGRGREDRPERLRRHEPGRSGRCRRSRRRRHRRVHDEHVRVLHRGGHLPPREEADRRRRCLRDPSAADQRRRGPGRAAAPQCAGHDRRPLRRRRAEHGQPPVGHTDPGRRGSVPTAA